MPYQSSPPSSKDRTAFQPPHRGPLIFPNSAFFAVLLRHAHWGRLAIRDDNAGIERTYAQLLTDALSLREALAKSLPSKVLDDIEAGIDVCIGVFAAGSYEYAVAMVGIYALGAAVVPMTVALPTKEAVYFVAKSRQVAIVTSTAAHSLGVATAQELKRSDDMSIPVLEVSQHMATSYPPIERLLLSSDRGLDENGAGLVIFTSGTTGLPKGAVLRRSFFSEDTRATAEHYGFDHRDTLLHVLPVHHAAGVMTGFLPFLSVGACVEFCSGSFDPAWTWDRWARGGITVFAGVPTIYTRMMRHYEEHISRRPEAEQRPFKTAATGMALMCGTSALPRPIQDFWTRLRGGKVILTRYGSTEAGAILRMPPNIIDAPDGSVGAPYPGADVKLADEVEGELLVRTPFMFSKYLYDDKATAEAFDSEGYFKTGDIARREGPFYFIVGRANQDIIKSGGYKISAFDIERELLSLPYINEAVVVGVDDDEFGQRVAAVVSLRTDQSVYTAAGQNGSRLAIDSLRRDLGQQLARYKMPTMLRVFDGDLPKTASGKVLKRTLGPRLFPSPGWKDIAEVQVWHPQSRPRL